MQMVLNEAPDDDVAELYREVEPGKKWVLIIDDHPDYQAKAQTTERQAQTEAALILSELARALTDIGVAPALKPGAVALLRGNFEVNGSGKVVATKAAGGADVGDFCRAWAATDQGRVYLIQAAGSDASGGGLTRLSRKIAGPNPYSAANWSVTEQGRLVNRDRELAHKMARAAGHVSAIGAKRAHAR